MQQLTRAAREAVARPAQGRISQALLEAMVGDAPADADHAAGAVGRWPGWLRMATLLAAPILAWAALIAFGIYYLAL